VDDDVTIVKTQPAANQPTRRERADATRLRITKAAYALFCERGYAGTMLADVAKASGVAVQTVRFIFHTKGELLSRAYDYAVLGGGEPVPPQRQPWWTAAASAPDVTVALRHLVPGMGAILARATPLDTVVRGSVTGDPETARVRALHEQWRAEGYREVLDLLVSKAHLGPGITPERATHLLLLYLGMDVYRVLVDDLGWTHEAWGEWVVTTVSLELFGRVAEPAPRSAG
jgi:AcrR family transcriptional regulator